MRDRVRTIWVPGLLTMLLAFTGQALLIQDLHNVVHLRGMFLVISIPWLVLLTGSGAIGAYLCRQEGGSPIQRVLVAVSPALTMAGFLIAAFGVNLVVDSRLPAALRLNAIGSSLVWETVIPAMALLMGAIPVVASEAVDNRIENRG